jgi:monoamine oxidase
MKSSTSDYPLIIIGAGAAGIAASELASEKGIKNTVLEASHRRGGRGLTEYMEGGVAVDLGCHWMHCASKNPYVKLADQYGFSYESANDYNPAMLGNGEWLKPEKVSEYSAYMRRSYKNVEALYAGNPYSAVIDGFDTVSEWAQQAFYYMTLQHSNDIDEVSAQDFVDYDELNEDWPVKGGFGALIEKHGESCEIALNTQVKKVDWSASPIKITTNKGTVTADKIIITVSTGVLSSGDIEFLPKLPVSKREAIDALPLGNSNYTFFTLEEGSMDADAPKDVHYQQDDISMYIHMQQFGLPVTFSSTGGRFAWWLEKQGPDASRDYFETALVSVFGSSIRSKLREFKVSAWGYDPWVRGAYSSQKPGTINQRKELGLSLNEAVFFAGEATSENFLNTAHGAYFSGRRAVSEVIASM